MEHFPKQETFVVNVSYIQTVFPNLESIRKFALHEGKLFPSYEGMNKWFFLQWITGRKKLLNIYERASLEMASGILSKLLWKEDLVALVRGNEKFNAYFPDKIDITSYPVKFFIDVIYKEDPKLFYQLYERYKAMEFEMTFDKGNPDVVVVDATMKRAIDAFHTLDKKPFRHRSSSFSSKERSPELMRHYGIDYVNKLFYKELISRADDNESQLFGKLTFSSNNYIFWRSDHWEGSQKKMKDYPPHPKMFNPIWINGERMTTIFDKDINVWVINRLVEENYLTPELLAALVRRGKISEEIFSYLLENNYVSCEMFLLLLKKKLISMDAIKILANKGLIMPWMHNNIMKAAREQHLIADPHRAEMQEDQNMRSEEEFP